MNNFLESARGASYYTRPTVFNSERMRESKVSANRLRVNPSSDWTDVVDELLRIRNLKDNWDGEGSLSPELILVDGAITFARHLSTLDFSPPERVHLGVNGTIYFEWYANIGYHEIEIFAPNQVESRFIRRGSDKTEIVRIEISVFMSGSE